MAKAKSSSGRKKGSSRQPKNSKYNRNRNRVPCDLCKHRKIRCTYIPDRIPRLCEACNRANLPYCEDHPEWDRKTVSDDCDILNGPQFPDPFDYPPYEGPNAIPDPPSVQGSSSVPSVPLHPEANIMAPATYGHVAAEQLVFGTEYYPQDRGIDGELPPKDGPQAFDAAFDESYDDGWWARVQTQPRDGIDPALLEHAAEAIVTQPENQEQHPKNNDQVTGVGQLPYYGPYNYGQYSGFGN